MSARTILSVVPGLQASALVGYNLQNVPKFKMKPNKKLGMKRPIRRLVKTGVGTMVGISLIRPTSTMINQL